MPLVLPPTSARGAARGSGWGCLLAWTASLWTLAAAAVAWGQQWSCWVRLTADSRDGWGPGVTTAAVPQATEAVAASAVPVVAHSGSGPKPTEEGVGGRTRSDVAASEGDAGRLSAGERRISSSSATGCKGSGAANLKPPSCTMDMFGTTSKSVSGMLDGSTMVDAVVVASQACAGAALHVLSVSRKDEVLATPALLLEML